MNNTIAQRPSISEVYDKIIEIINKQYILPKTSNKGKPGNYLEELVGIPRSSACLDCTDGEVKVFPVKKIKSGKFVPKETIAVTMINNEDIKNHSFDDSRCYKKLLNTQFIPFKDYWIFEKKQDKDSFLFQRRTEELWEKIIELDSLYGKYVQLNDRLRSVHIWNKELDENNELDENIVTIN
jgi:hypothetical protein